MRAGRSEIRCFAFADGVKVKPVLPLGKAGHGHDRRDAGTIGHQLDRPCRQAVGEAQRRLPDPITAMASGWMRVRQRARQRNVELPLVISDHADWGELPRTIEEVNPQETWITHGREEALLRWCQLHQRRAQALALVGYEDEDD